MTSQIDTALASRIEKLVDDLYQNVANEIGSQTDNFNKVPSSSGYTPQTSAGQYNPGQKPTFIFPRWKGLRGLFRYLWKGNSPDNPDYANIVKGREEWERNQQANQQNAQVNPQTNIQREWLESMSYSAIRSQVDITTQELQEEIFGKIGVLNEAASPKIKQFFDDFKRSLTQAITQYGRVIMRSQNRGGQAATVPQTVPQQVSQTPPTPQGNTTADDSTTNGDGAQVPPSGGAEGGTDTESKPAAKGKGKLQWYYGDTPLTTRRGRVPAAGKDISDNVVTDPAKIAEIIAKQHAGYVKKRDGVDSYFTPDGIIQNVDKKWSGDVGGSSTPEPTQSTPKVPSQSPQQEAPPALELKSNRDKVAPSDWAALSAEVRKRGLDSNSTNEFLKNIERSKIKDNQGKIDAFNQISKQLGAYELRDSDDSGSDNVETPTALKDISSPESQVTQEEWDSLTNRIRNSNLDDATKNSLLSRVDRAKESDRENQISAFNNISKRVGATVSSDPPVSPPQKPEPAKASSSVDANSVITDEDIAALRNSLRQITDPEQRALRQRIVDNVSKSRNPISYNSVKNLIEKDIKNQGASSEPAATEPSSTEPQIDAPIEPQVVEPSSVEDPVEDLPVGDLPSEEPSEEPADEPADDVQSTLSPEKEELDSNVDRLMQTLDVMSNDEFGDEFGDDEPTENPLMVVYDDIVQIGNRLKSVSDPELIADLEDEIQSLENLIANPKNLRGKIAMLNSSLDRKGVPRLDSNDVSDDDPADLNPTDSVPDEPVEPQTDDALDQDGDSEEVASDEIPEEPEGEDSEDPASEIEKAGDVDLTSRDILGGWSVEEKTQQLRDRLQNIPGYQINNTERKQITNALDNVNSPSLSEKAKVETLKYVEKRIGEREQIDSDTRSPVKVNPSIESTVRDNQKYRDVLDAIIDQGKQGSGIPSAYLKPVEDSIEKIINTTRDLEEPQRSRESSTRFQKLLDQFEKQGWIGTNSLDTLHNALMDDTSRSVVEPSPEEDEGDYELSDDEMSDVSLFIPRSKKNNPNRDRELEREIRNAPNHTAALAEYLKAIGSDAGGGSKKLTKARKEKIRELLQSDNDSETDLSFLSI